MSTLDDVKSIDLHELAERLGFKRDGAKKGNGALYFRQGENNASLSIFEKGDGQGWKDHAEDRGGRNAISFYCYAKGLPEDDWKTAADELRQLFGMPSPLRRQNGNGHANGSGNGAAPREQTKEGFIAQQCLREPAAALEYLAGRGVARETLALAVQRRTLGFNDWTSSSIAAGEKGHGGPAAAFIVRDVHDQVLAVDFRYLDPALNGGLKTKTTGQKEGAPWVLCWKRLQRARTVYVVESAINALCIEGCGLPGAAALAIRGVGNADNIDWRVLQGKRVVLALDADEADENGKRPGPQAAWKIYDHLVGLNIACLLVDQKAWYEDKLNDCADIAQQRGLQDLRERLCQLEPWAIQGLPGKDGPNGRQRVFLPSHDFAVYWRFRVKEDFTSFVAKVESDNDEGGEQLKFADLAGFRVAAITRVTIQSATSTMSGEEDAQPNTVFAVSVQVPRHGPKLLRRVLDDDRLHNTDQWKKLGPIFHQGNFLRLLNILERTADIGAREAVNFVGLCWRNGRPSLNEGPDCYFTEPEKQCPYHNLLFPSGKRQDAQRVLEAYQHTFRDNAAAQLLVWALGGHLKAFLGFWPHCILQADKGSGKSTLIKRLERSIGMTMFGGQSLQTEFRLLTSISATSHPIGWEEISARDQKTIDKAVAMLQESYQFTVTKRGSEMTEYLQCAPVLLAGEDVPVRSLTGKVVRTDLTGRKGPLLPETLPRFPVREWIQFLAGLDRETVAAALAEAEAQAWAKCRATREDNGASRMVRNYATLACAWRFLCEFADLAIETGNFLATLHAEMNAHIAETSGDREPFVWILETFVSEVESGQFAHPLTFDEVEGEACALFRPQHVMDHLQTNTRLREIWNGLPVKSGRVFKRQIEKAGLVIKEGLERRIGGHRHAHLSAISLQRLAGYGVHLSEPTDNNGYPRYNREGSNE